MSAQAGVENDFSLLALPGYEIGCVADFDVSKFADRLQISQSIMIRGADYEKIWFWHVDLLFYWTGLSFSRQRPATYISQLTSRNSHLVGGRPIDGRNGDVVQAEIHAQLGPVMNDVIHQ
jgi:hypothetical protein